MLVTVLQVLVPEGEELREDELTVGDEPREDDAAEDKALATCGTTPTDLLGLGLAIDLGEGDSKLNPFTRRGRSSSGRDHT